MATFAQWLKDQENREDRVGWAAKMWANAQIGRISSPTGIVRKMREMAAELPEGSEDKGKWTLAIDGALQAAEEYRNRPGEGAAQPVPAEAVPVHAPVPPPAEPQVTGMITALPGGLVPAVQPPEGGIPISGPAVLPRDPNAERMMRIEKMFEKTIEMHAENAHLLTTIAEYLVLKGDQESLRRALAGALHGEAPQQHTSSALNWAAMFAQADHRPEPEAAP